MTEIIARICPNHHPAAGWQDMPAALEWEDDNTLIARILPVRDDTGLLCSEIVLTVYIIRTGDSVYCRHAGYVEWRRALSDVEQAGGSFIPNDFLTLFWNRPECCHYYKSILRLTGAEDRNLFLDRVLSLPAEIPSEGGKTAALLGRFPELVEDKLLEYEAAPGEELHLDWEYVVPGHSETLEDVATVFYRTPCLTGGRVTAINGDPAAVNHTYTVMVEGEEIECRPSDWVDYNLDDWVHVLCTDGLCPECGREPEYGKSSEDDNPATGAPIDSYFTDALDLLNEERADAGLDPLTVNADLTNAARRHANDMMVNGVWSHDGSDGSTPQERIGDTGYLDIDPEIGGTAGSGENIGMGQGATPDKMVESWMGSPGHKANILSSSWTEIGIAVKQAADGTLYWVTDFGFNESNPPEDPPPETVYVIVPYRVNNYGRVVS